MMELLTIGKIARLVEVGIETIRFYEREGLIVEPPRTETGYRQYPKDTVLRIRFIKQAKQLGFSLREIKELLSLRIDPKTSCEEVRERTKGKIAEIEEKMRTLQSMREALVMLTEACSGRGPVSACPILEALEE